MSEPWEDLEDAMWAPPDYEQPPEVPEGDEQADAWLRRLAGIGRAEDRVRALVNLERAKLDAYEAGELEKYRKPREWLADSLAQYHRAVLARAPRRKTIDLPNGTLKARAQQPAWDFPDEAAFIEWAAVNAPEFLRQPDLPPVEVEKAAVKKALAIQEDRDYAVDINGERVPGVAVTFREPKYVVEVKP